MKLIIDISVPRLAHKQNHRSNPPSDNNNEYWRRSLIIQYLGLLTSSLNIKIFPRKYSKENFLKTSYGIQKLNYLNKYFFPHHEKCSLNFEHYSMYYSDCRTIVLNASKSEDLS
ncbi:hypothetical protein PR048_010941 [Dryococelus australis]|uniref:Maturase K n=1 Tax=Dryococelus australis TaxID=614101 RepID=A0ABQ9HK67_9NEOP|nr:hypothetical protein PR048_010941 [Dryococelus australis]